jgi:putative ABC transport system permease protein
MIKNYLKIAFRNLFRHKAFSLINISGLAIGMASAVFILLWMYNQWAFDTFHTQKDRIYELWNKGNSEKKISCWNITPQPLAPTLMKDFPEVEYAVRVNGEQTSLFSYGEKRIMSEGSIVDPAFLKMFTFPLFEGSAETALKDAFSLVITEKLAKKIFGNENPMGKILKVDNEDNFTVTGVLKDIPANTRFQMAYLVSWEYIKYKKQENEFWGNNCTKTYALLKPNTTLASIEPKLKDLRRQYQKDNKTDEFFLYPMSRWRLYSQFVNGVEEGSLLTVIKFAGILAFFILLIACINFMNLSTARSEKRAKEVGIRKVVGAQKGALILQFIGESIILSCIAGIIALLIVVLLLPTFSKFVFMDIVFEYKNPVFWLSFIGFTVLTGVLAGLYPAFFLSSFQPVSVLKGTFKKENALITPRKALVVIQFTFAIVLILGTIIVQQQIVYGLNRDAGFSKDNIIYLDLNGDIPKNYSSIKTELLASGAVTTMTKTFSPITEGWSNTKGIEWTGKNGDDKTLFDRFSADDKAAKTLGFQMIEGRDFDLSTYPTDSSAVLLNESALKTMALKEPIGQIIKDGDTKWHVIGVVKDFLLRNPYKPATPTVIQGAKRGLSILHLKLNNQWTMAENLKHVEAVFKKYNPEYPFDYKFVDEQYAKKFEKNQRMGQFGTLFSALSIFISCLGLFGLATYMAENRIKEIGVRKVLGASVVSIISLLSKDFIKLVGLAIALASPIAYYLMNKWLQDFPYRITINWWIFVLAGVLALFIALLTVSFQAMKAAVANPVNSLRNE